MKIGVYVCECGINIASMVDMEKVVEFAKELPNVAIARWYKFMCSDPGQETIQKDIGEFGLDRIIVAACSPRMHEPTFRSCVEKVGVNPYCFEMVNIREQNSWVHTNRVDATKKAMTLIAGAVSRAILLEPLTRTKVGVIPQAMVIGGGIAGIQSALDIANNGFKVYLIEKSPTIGGRMAQLDKTFPTLDCSACILTPKMSDLGRHPNIYLLPNTEVTKVDGYVGNFKVTLKKNVTYVIPDKCNACGDCADICPVIVPNEFDLGLSPRKAIYIPFPQAVPNKYVIDDNKCIKCGLCKRVCEPEAIDLDLKTEEEIVEVGAIVMASGFDVFDASIAEFYGYGRYENVINGLQMERLFSSFGPTLGDVVKISNINEHPKNIAFIHCVGSRSLQEGFNPYCSRVCCMYLIKQARLYKEKHPEAECVLFYIDIRAFGKGFEEFYNATQSQPGVRFIRGRIAEIYENPDKTLTLRSEDTLLDRPLELTFDMVVLGVGLVPKDNLLELARLFNLSRSPDGFLMEAHPKLRPNDTFTDGVFLAGCVQGPKDIPDTVAQASGAAAKVCEILSQKYLEIEPITSIVNEAKCRGCGFCVEVCPYTAIELKTVNQYGHLVTVAHVNEALCKGCGSCNAACLSGAIEQRHFKDNQILAIIKTFTQEGV
ncbi:MAG: 4Fe-4S binding protein [Promethearchaeota archaeon]